MWAFLQKGHPPMTGKRFSLAAAPLQGWKQKYGYRLYFVALLYFLLGLIYAEAMFSDRRPTPGQQNDICYWVLGLVALITISELLLSERRYYGYILAASAAFSMFPLVALFRH